MTLSDGSVQSREWRTDRLGMNSQTVYVHTLVPVLSTTRFREATEHDIFKFPVTSQ